MNVLLIDESTRRMQILRRFLARILPDVAVAEYDVDQRGPPPEGFDWSEFDVVVLNQELGMGEVGVEWIEKYRGEPAFPPVVLIANELAPKLLSSASKAGASTLLPRDDLTPEMLAEAVQNATGLPKRPAMQGGEPARAPGGPDVQVIERILGANQDSSSAGYRFMRLIGQGPMSRVYLAERARDRQSVVLKLLDGTLAEDDESVQRQIHEASLVAGIRSPYVVRIFEQGVSDRYGFIAMEFFAKGDLKQRLERGISMKTAFVHFLHLMRGLHAIHRAGIVHRDLKPANIMFRDNEALGIADFGAPCKIDGAAPDGALPGTPAYMSPEQISGAPADHRSDLYSAGILLYEMLARKRPFVADTFSAIATQHLYGEPPPLPREAHGFEPIYRRLLAKDPADRFQSAAEVITELKSLIRPPRTSDTAFG